MADASIGALQGALKVTGHYTKGVDGIAGSETRKSVLRSPENAKRWADIIGGAAATFVDTALSARQPVAASQSEIVKIVHDAAKEFGVSPSSALAKAYIESGLRTGVVNNYGYAGLFQMGDRAWTDARAYLARVGKEDVGSYDSNKLDARSNSRAAFAYRRALGEQLASYGVPAPHSDAVLYLAHQQGAKGFSRLVSAARNGTPAGDNSSMVTAMKNNPPQDGKGVTYDPAAFIRRWELVFDERTRQYA